LAEKIKAMKQLYNVFLQVFIITASLLLPACNDLDENPLSIEDFNKYYNSYNNLNSTAMGMYAALRGGADWSYGMFQTQYMIYMFGADDMTTIAGGNKEPYRQFDQFNKTTVQSDEWLTRPWKTYYRAIINANAIITNFHFTQGDSADIYNIVGQAHFVRALSYFYLVRGWGKIPLFTEPFASLTIGRSPVNDVYDLIINDFKQAESYLPNTQHEIGRPSKGAAKAFLAKAYLTKAGWPIKDETCWELAASKALEVIENKDLYGFGLLDEYKSVWLRVNDNSKESVFSIQCDALNDAGYRTYTNHIFGTAMLPYDLYGGWDDFFPELTFFREFPAGPRKDATFLTKFYKTKRNPSTGAYNIIDTLDYTEMKSKHPYYAKFLDGGITPNQPWKNDFHVASAYPLMRYAEVLLIYAEAQARFTGPDAGAYDAVNQVRNRSGIGDLTPGLGAAAFADSVIDERGWELAGEGQRWFDLLRTEKISETIAKRDTAEQVEVSGPISDDNWYAPIPAREILQNPNLSE
jgi:starch-binding outer membrane protein, SusD/RagB family